MTFKLLLDNVKARLDKNSTTTPDVTTPRLKRFMNDRYRELMRIDGAGDSIRDETIQVTATRNVPRLTLPSALSTISNVVDTVNRVKLAERSLGWIRRQDPSDPAMVTGTPWCYAVLNEAGVSAQPTSTAATLSIVSTASPDTRRYWIEAQLAAGQVQLLSGQLNGTTPVAVGTGVRQVYRLTIDDVVVVAANTVTLSQLTPTVLTLITLGQGQPTITTTQSQQAKHAWTLHLWPTPSAAITYSIDFARPTFELVTDWDEPALPEDFHSMLVWGCCEEECLKMDDSRAKYFAEKWATDLKAFRAYLHRSRGAKWVPQTRRPRFSTLGPYFPADWD